MLMNYLKSFIWSLGIFLSSIIILTIFNYFNILNGTILKVLELFIPLISIFIGSYKLGKTSNQKGYIEGLKYSGIWVIIFWNYCKQIAKILNRFFPIIFTFYHII